MTRSRNQLAQVSVFPSRQEKVMIVGPPGGQSMEKGKLTADLCKVEFFGHAKNVLDPGLKRANVMFHFGFLTSCLTGVIARARIKGHFCRCQRGLLIKW